MPETQTFVSTTARSPNLTDRKLDIPLDIRLGQPLLVRARASTRKKAVEAAFPLVFIEDCDSLVGQPSV